MRAHVCSSRGCPEWSCNAIRRLLATLDAARAQCAEAERERDDWRNNILAIICDYRGVSTPCEQCEGIGTRTYANTATWRGGIGGQMMTVAVCDGCWGTGDAHRHGVNLRDVNQLRAQCAEVERESRALHTLLDQARQCIDPEQHPEWEEQASRVLVSCDTNFDLMIQERDQLRAQLAEALAQRDDTLQKWVDACNMARRLGTVEKPKCPTCGT